MASQDLILPLLLRIAPPRPLTQQDLAGVTRISKRPVVEDEWDRKQPVQEDRVFDPLLHPDHQQQGQAHSEAHAQAQAEAATEEEQAPSASPEDEHPGHIDTYV